MHRADGAEEAGATDHGRGDRLQFPAFRLSRVADADTRCQQDTNKGGAKCRQNISNVDHPNRIDARKSGRLRIGANREKVATKPTVM